MFKLTDEQVNYIIDMYGGSRFEIGAVEQKLNKIEIIQDEDLFLEILISVIAQMQTIKFNKKRCNTKEEKDRHHMSVNEIIKMELIRKCAELNQSKIEIETIVKSKIRH